VNKWIALDYFRDNFDKPFCRTGVAADLIGVNADSLKTKVAVGQIPVHRVSNSHRDRVLFTGESLIKTILWDAIGVTGREAHVIYEQEKTHMWLDHYLLSSRGVVSFLPDLRSLIVEDATIIVPMGKLIERLAVGLYVCEYPMEAINSFLTEREVV